VGINASYFLRKTKNLITETPIDPSTGFSSTFTNIGELRGNGISRFRLTSCKKTIIKVSTRVII
jgi:hypothetical protein